MSLRDQAYTLFSNEGENKDNFVEGWMKQINNSYSLILVAPELDQSAIRVIDAQFEKEIPITGIEVKSYTVPGQDSTRMMDSRIVAGNPNILSSIPRRDIIEIDPARVMVSKINGKLIELLGKEPDLSNLYIKPGSGRYRLIMDSLLMTCYVWYSITVYNEGRNAEFFIETYMGGDNWNNYRAKIHSLFEGKLGSDIIQGLPLGKKQWSKKFELSPLVEKKDEITNITQEFVNFISKTYPLLIESLKID